MKCESILIWIGLLLIPGWADVQDFLKSWNDTAAKQSIISFVEKVTKEGSPDFVPPAERIATLDNDGTLWSEQPMYFQLLFALDRVKALAPKHPEWKDQEPFASLLKGDVKEALAGGEHAILEIVMATHAGNTTEEFEKIVKDWIATAKHPKTGRLYTEMIFQPMVEVLAYLRANGFKTYIVSGGGIEFMRPGPSKSMASRPSKSSAAVSRRSSNCVTESPCWCAFLRLTSLTTEPASRLASINTSAVVPSPLSATRMATCKCLSGPPPDKDRDLPSTFITPMPSANGRTTANPASAAWTKGSTKQQPKAGPLSI